MMKLVTLLAMVAALGCGGSKDKGKDNAADDKTAAVQTKPIDNGKPDEKKPDEKKPDEKKPDEKKPDEKKVEEKASDLPADCGEWRDAVAKLASCEKLPAPSRDQLKQAYETAAAGWTSLPADGKAAVAQACKAGVETVKQAAAACAQ